ncbi:MAG: epoxyqueuosine reductase QueH [Candidatus Omnitrophota bacterium]|nr:epoxyqueuosine reductase QueH [Candidatus Omnitrophota bacterium]
MKLLLHTCCAPCLIYPLERLREQGFAPVAYYYNPNIHPLAEYNLRMQAAEELAAGMSADFISPEYRPQDFFRAVCNNESGKERCLACWNLRMERSAEFARANGFDYFSTTLLVSPYQDQDALKEIGVSVAAKKGVKFHGEDFRPGFRKAHERARAKGIYCQKYCGCLYSEIERWTKR